MRSAAFITLGCKTNQYETQVMREALKRKGYVIADSDEPADVYVINTCTVTGVSDRKSRQVIRRAAAQNPDAIIIVTGCYAERCPEEIRDIPEVDLVLPNCQKPFIDEHLDKIMVMPSDTSRNYEDRDFITTFNGQTRALIKIEDGCDSFCTYCIVPHVRGGFIRSRPVASIVREAQALAASGHRELVLTGIHLGAYGKDMVDGTKLHHVIRSIHDVDGIQRIRLSSIEPMDISDDLISDISRLPKCAHHFHISLQSGSDKILGLMNRGYTSADFEKLASRIRAAIPDVGISTDVMVGFPGETEQDVMDTYSLISRVKFSRLHVFRYSPRPGTPAVSFPGHVQESVAYRRSQRIRALGERLAREFCIQLLGKTAEVLVEDSREGKDNLLAGFTSNYVRVLITDAGDALAGQMVLVKLIDIEGEYVIGHLLNNNSASSSSSSPKLCAA